MDMREQKFGIEIEMTGITRQRAAEVMAAYFSSVASYDGGSYEVYSVRDAAGRRWKVMYDSSIEAQKKGGGYAGSEYKVEFVSPICEYADIPVIQELIRQLRHAGAVAGKNTGIHVHINAAQAVFYKTSLAWLLAVLLVSAGIIFLLSPMHSKNRKLDKEEQKHFGRKARLIAALELAVLGILWHAGQIPYAYAVYTGIFITALFMLVGKAQLWIQSHTENG